MKPAISVLTPTVRPEGLVMPWQCLERQTCQDFEWLISAPAGVMKVFPNKPNIHLLEDPPKRPGDYYRLNGAWNNLAKHAKADLLVFCVDWIWFEDTALEQLLAHYLDDPNRGICVPGNHFRKIINGRPEVLWEPDNRWNHVEPDSQGMIHRPYLLPEDQIGDGWHLDPHLMEMSFSGISKSKLISVGGFDEDYDRHFAMSEKETCMRMFYAGYSFILDRTQNHRIYTHDREISSSEQDWRYQVSVKYFQKHVAEMAEGKRRVIPWAGLEN